MMNVMDEIVEERIWRHGVEIVSRVNWTLLGQLRRSLGLFGDHFENNPMQLSTLRLHASIAGEGAEARPLVLRKRSQRRDDQGGREFGPSRKSA